MGFPLLCRGLVSNTCHQIQNSCFRMNVNICCTSCIGRGSAPLYKFSIASRQHCIPRSCGILVYRDLTSIVTKKLPGFICIFRIKTVCKKWFVSSIKEGISLTMILGKTQGIVTKTQLVIGRQELLVYQGSPLCAFLVKDRMLVF